MYKNNSRGSGNFKDCSLLQHSSNPLAITMKKQNTEIFY